ncbi:MHYT domain-containing protein, NO-binding membrane sensor [Tistlia consotensis]|uniref:MHYT domain-containing protein, NO-binding membrane sensor n=1 Tax=Tistlia consotensis USBA 355 TaxID=560819 RepID=A0A1Y6CGM1_9PROT|nr:MHYT domain-containing protein [Tistlia consotensis]SMF64270.1 MHYT domain-containing protein, NO-binding membrane sensor [Tistlia consotensis USBA 355]SNR97601.1 MHYT domain-containing protein, NO-binding membrane sensor [Tistlia consotensis]
MIEVRYDPWLVAASVAVAVMAAFTCLRLTSGLSATSTDVRKARIAEAAIALGGGIWSMHFVAMMAVQLNVVIFYDPLRTLGSALIAVLVTGTALLLLHFGERTPGRIVVAGCLTGIGIVAMHYLGMSAITGNCLVAFGPWGVALASAIGIGASILAMEMAYRKRTRRATLTGSVLLGLAVSAMHYSAMAFTTFRLTDSPSVTAVPALSQGSLALIVALAAFVICGLFLLMAVPGEMSAADAGDVRPEAAVGRTAPARLAERVAARLPDQSAVLSKAFVRGRQTAVAQVTRIPYEKDNTIRFLPSSAILAVRAEGHYTRIQDAQGEFFCPWSISRIEAALDPETFLRTHRSYLVNRQHISGFRKSGDKGACFLGEGTGLEVPVSRGRLQQVEALLGLT